MITVVFLHDVPESIDQSFYCGKNNPPILGNPSISKNFIAESNLAHMAEHWQEGYYSATVT